MNDRYYYVTLDNRWSIWINWFLFSSSIIIVHFDILLNVLNYCSFRMTRHYFLKCQNKNRSCELMILFLEGLLMIGTFGRHVKSSQTTHTISPAEWSMVKLIQSSTLLEKSENAGFDSYLLLKNITSHGFIIFDLWEKRIASVDIYTKREKLVHSPFICAPPRDCHPWSNQFLRGASPLFWII